MKGNDKVLAVLNQLLADELTAINSTSSPSVLDRRMAALLLRFCMMPRIRASIDVERCGR